MGADVPEQERGLPLRAGSEAPVVSGRPHPETLLPEVRHLQPLSRRRPQKKGVVGKIMFLEASGPQFRVYPCPPLPSAVQFGASCQLLCSLTYKTRVMAATSCTGRGLVSGQRPPWGRLAGVPVLVPQVEQAGHRHGTLLLSQQACMPPWLSQNLPRVCAPVPFCLSPGEPHTPSRDRLREKNLTST